MYRLATDAQLQSITDRSQLVIGGKVGDSKEFANSTEDYRTGNYYNAYKDGNLYVVYRAVPKSKEGKAQLNFVDDDENGKNVGTDSSNGVAGSEISFANGQTTLNDLISKGYEYVSPEGTDLTSTTAAFDTIKFPKFDDKDDTDGIHKSILFT